MTFTAEEYRYPIAELKNGKVSMKNGDCCWSCNFSLSPRTGNCLWRRPKSAFTPGWTRKRATTSGRSLARSSTRGVGAAVVVAAAAAAAIAPLASLQSPRPHRQQRHWQAAYGGPEEVLAGHRRCPPCGQRAVACRHTARTS